MLFVFLALFIDMYVFYTFFILYFFISLPLVFFTVFFACNSTFEQGHMEPWRYINAFIIIIINPLTETIIEM